MCTVTREVYMTQGDQVVQGVDHLIVIKDLVEFRY